MNKRTMTTKDIQSIGLDILKDIHSFCVANNIRYSLYGGTMLGAVRHGGFIPWDDDVDIAMPRDDYNRFVESFVSQSGYKLFCPEKGNSWLTFARVCEMESTSVINRVVPWCGQETGVWVDVFPLDGASDIREKVVETISSLVSKNKILNRFRVTQAKFPLFSKDIKLMANYLRICCLMHMWKGNIDQLRRSYIDECASIPFGSTNHYSNFAYAGGYGIREYQEQVQFDSLISLPFETEKFFCLEGYDQHMRNKYGDYMTPPERKNQKGHSYYAFFWKRSSDVKNK